LHQVGTSSLLIVLVISFLLVVLFTHFILDKNKSRAAVQLNN